MRQSDLLEASPIGKIVEPNSGQILGWIFLWNTGEVGDLWLSPANEKVERHMLDLSDPDLPKTDDGI